MRGDPATGDDGASPTTRVTSPTARFSSVCPASRHDGHDFAAAAVEAGAAALVCERDTGVDRAAGASSPPCAAPMALLAARWYGDPSRAPRVVGITGTNGKTTTAHLIAASVRGRRTADGPAGDRRATASAGWSTPVQLTTAESLDLQRMFAQMVAAGDRACAIEVSSHALAQDRAAGIDFDVVVFSNLTRDHLDFHKDLDDYFAAKRRLFLPDERRNGAAVAIVNDADDFGARLAGECRPEYGDDLWTCAVDDGADAGAAVTARDLDLRADGSAFTLACPRLGDRGTGHAAPGGALQRRERPRRRGRLRSPSGCRPAAVTAASP